MIDVYGVRDGFSLRKGSGIDLANGLFSGWPSGILYGVFGEFLIIVGAIEIGAEFPDVAGHVVETKVVGREASHWSGACEAVQG